MNIGFEVNRLKLKREQLDDAARANNETNRRYFSIEGEFRELKRDIIVNNNLLEGKWEIIVDEYGLFPVALEKYDTKLYEELAQVLPVGVSSRINLEEVGSHWISLGCHRNRNGWPGYRIELGRVINNVTELVEFCHRHYITVVLTDECAEMLDRLILRRRNDMNEALLFQDAFGKESEG